MIDDTEITEMAVAYLAAEGMSQTRIGQSLSLSQSAVSRLLERARKPDRYLEVQAPYRFRRELVDDAAMDAVLRRTSRKLLPKYLKEFARKNDHSCVPAVRVFPSVQKEGLHRFMDFTQQAAPYVASLVMRDSVRTCGVTWGYMLSD